MWVLAAGFLLLMAVTAHGFHRRGERGMALLCVAVGIGLAAIIILLPPPTYPYGGGGRFVGR